MTKNKVYFQAFLTLSLVCLALLIGLGRWNDGRQPPEVIADPPVTVKHDVTIAAPTEVTKPQGRVSKLTLKLHEGIYGEFETWVMKYVNASSVDEKKACEAEGLVLATDRHKALYKLIKTDPKHALEVALPFEARIELPAEVAKQLEKQIDKMGQLTTIACMPDAPPVAEIEKRIYLTHGKQLTPGQTKIPLHGISVDWSAAFSEEWLRKLEPAEATAYLAAHPKELPLSDGQVLADAGGSVHRFDSLQAYEAKSRENYTGGSIGISGPQDPQDLANHDMAHSGKAKLLFMRIIFPDDTSEPITETDAYKTLADVDKYYAENSYGKFSILPTVTPLLMMPRVTRWYTEFDFSDQNNQASYFSILYNDALDASAAAGFDPSEYIFVPMRTNVLGGVSFAALGGPRVIASFSVLKDNSGGTWAHEFGHNLGMTHSNSWNAETVDAPGGNTEYGNPFDTMGAGNGDNNNTTYGHNNVAWKNLMTGWLPDSYINQVGKSGTYRIYAMDYGRIDPAYKYALRFQKDDYRTYYVEFRKNQFKNDNFLRNGVCVNWQPWWGNNGGTGLLNPSSDPGAKVVLIGTTLSDTKAGINITPIAQGGVEPDQWVDVTVNFGDSDAIDTSFPIIPLSGGIAASPPGPVATNSNVTFTVNGSDADGDTLAYFWTFGDGTGANLTYDATNKPSVSYKFTKVGRFRVRCEVTDAKGKTAAKSIIVSVGGGGSTFNMDGQVTWNGKPVLNARISGAGNPCLTDTDGTYTLTNTNGGSITGFKWGFRGLFAPAYYKSITPPPDDRFSNKLEPTFGMPLPGGFDSGGLKFKTVQQTTLTITEVVPNTKKMNSVYLDPRVPTTGNPPVSTIPGSGGGKGSPGNLEISDPPPIEGATFPNQDDLPRAKPVSNLNVTEGTTKTIRFYRNWDGGTGPEQDDQGIVTSASRYAPWEGRDYWLYHRESNPQNPYISNARRETVTFYVTTPGMHDTFSATPGSIYSNVFDSVRLNAEQDPQKNINNQSIGDGDCGEFLIQYVDPENPAKPQAGQMTWIYTTLGGANSVYYNSTQTTVKLIPAAVLSRQTYLQWTIAFRPGEWYRDVKFISKPDTGVNSPVDGPRVLNIALKPSDVWRNRDSSSQNLRITILDSDPTPPTVTVQTDPGNENPAEDGSQQGRFVVSRTGDLTNPLTVTYNLSGTASQTLDYQLTDSVPTVLARTVTIPAGQASTNVFVTGVLDSIQDPNETVILSIADPATLVPPNNSYRLPDSGTYSSAIVILQDSQITPVISIVANINTASRATLEKGQFTFSRTGDLTVEMIVPYSISGTALNGEDYARLWGSVKFAAGQSIALVDIIPLENALVEDDQAVVLSVTSTINWNTNPLKFRDTVTIKDTHNPSKPRVSVSSADGLARRKGNEIFGFTFTRYNTKGILNVKYAISGTAVYNVDYREPSTTPPPELFDGTITIPDGQYSVQIFLTALVVGSEPQPSETVIVTLLDNAGTYTIDSLANTATDVIRDGNDSQHSNTITITCMSPDPVPIIIAPGGDGNTATSIGLGSGVNPKFAIEGTRDRFFVLLRSEDKSNSLTVQISFSGTAVLGTDYTLQSEVDLSFLTVDPITQTAAVTFAPGNDYVRYCLHAPDNGQPEGTRKAIVTIVTGADYSKGVPGDAEILIQDAQADQLTTTVGFGRGSDTGLESGGVIQIPVVLDQASTDTIVVDYYIVGGTATNTARYAFTSGSLTFLPGVVAATIPLTLIDNSRLEPDETVIIGLRNAYKAKLGEIGYTYVILDDDSFPEASFQTAAGSDLEADAIVQIPVLLNTASISTVTVNYAVTGGNAISGQEYSLPNGTLTYLPGATFATIPLQIIHDGLNHPNDTIFISLSGYSNCKPGLIVQYTYTIIDIDPKPTIGFSTAAASGSESVANPVITVAMAGASGSAVTIDYAITGGTAASGGVDYTFSSGTLTFAAGETTKTVPVTIIDDTTLETDETIIFTLSNASGVTIGGNPVYTYTITDNDLSTPTFSSGPTATPNPADIKQAVQFSCVLNGAFGAVVWNWTFGDGSFGTSGSNITHTYTAAGSYTVSLTATDAKGQVASGSLVLVVASPVQNFTLAVGAAGVGGGSVTQSPSSASYAPGTVVTLTATPNVGSVFSIWTGAISTSANPTTITMDGNKSVTAIFNHPAPPPDGDLDGDGVPNGIDTDIDGDGFGNDQEIALGSDPYNAGSIPVNPGIAPDPKSPNGDFDGDGVMNIDDIDDDNDSISDLLEIADGTSPFDASAHRIIPLPMIVSKMSAGVKYTSANKDGLSISGFIPNVNAGFKPAGTQISFNIAGAQTTTFTLDGKGRAKSSVGQLTLKSKAMKINKATKQLVLLVDGNVSFTLKYKGALGADWTDDGVTGNKKNAPISIQIDMTLDGAPYSTTITALVNSNDKGGKLKK